MATDISGCYTQIETNANGSGFPFNSRVVTNLDPIQIQIDAIKKQLGGGGGGGSIIMVTGEAGTLVQVPSPLTGNYKLYATFFAYMNNSASAISIVGSGGDATWGTAVSGPGNSGIGYQIDIKGTATSGQQPGVTATVSGVILSGIGTPYQSRVVLWAVPA